MISEDQKKESRILIKRLIDENKILKPKPNTKRFFLDKAINSLEISRRLMEISNNKEDPLKGYMWVINSAYYSMFFAATAMLAHFNHKINVNSSIHKLTFHALIYYFLIDDKKIEKHFIEEYKETYEDAEELLQNSQGKAEEIVKNLDREREKRSRFTYEIGKVAEQKKAETSVTRAEEFLSEIMKIIS